MTQHIIEDKDSITIIDVPEDLVTTITEPERTSLVILSGSPGIKGDKGDPPSAADIKALVDIYLAANPVSSGIVFTQIAPASTWTIPNSLGRLCSVAIIVSGRIVYADTTVSQSQVVISFPAPISGSAILT